MVLTNSMCGMLRGCEPSLASSGVELVCICSARLTASFKISKLFASFMVSPLGIELRDFDVNPEGLATHFYRCLSNA